jgi:hypothetical protein
MNRTDGAIVDDAWATLDCGQALGERQRTSLATTGWTDQDMVAGPTDRDVVATCCALIANGCHESGHDIVRLAVSFGDYAARADAELRAAVALHCARWLIHTRSAALAGVDTGAAIQALALRVVAHRRLSGALRLAHAVAYARLGQPEMVMPLLESAATIATMELGDDPWHTTFSPVNVEMHRSSVLADLGDRTGARALEAIKGSAEEDADV